MFVLLPKKPGEPLRAVMRCRDASGRSDKVYIVQIEETERGLYRAVGYYGHTTSCNLNVNAFCVATDFTKVIAAAERQIDRKLRKGYFFPTGLDTSSYSLPEPYRGADQKKSATPAAAPKAPKPVLLAKAQPQWMW